jgi:hypothetical protein
MALGEVYVEDELCIADLERLAVTAPAMAAAGVNIVLEEAVAKAEEDVKVDTGETKGSIGMTPATPSEVFDADVHADAPYASVVEWNTVPHRPPYRALLDWTSRHPSNMGFTNAQFAYLIANKIEQEGTKGKPFLAYLADEWLPEQLEIQITLAFEAWALL